MFTRDNEPVLHSPPLTWRRILQEEPFEGQHWQGAYGLPEGSTVENWDQESSDSDLFSLLGGADSSEGIASSVEDEPFRPQAQRDQRQRISTTFDGREIVETLRAKQYWRSGWHTDADLRRRFDIGDPSTLGKGLHANS